MTFEDAIKMSIKKYFEGRMPEELMKSSGKEMKYTMEYFDQLEADMEKGDDPKVMAEDEEEDIENVDS
jgi:hypothetical protein